MIDEPITSTVLEIVKYILTFIGGAGGMKGLDLWKDYRRQKLADIKDIHALGTESKRLNIEEDKFTVETLQKIITEVRTSHDQIKKENEAIREKHLDCEQKYGKLESSLVLMRLELKYLKEVLKSNGISFIAFSSDETTKPDN